MSPDLREQAHNETVNFCHLFSQHHVLSPSPSVYTSPPTGNWSGIRTSACQQRFPVAAERWSGYVVRMSRYPSADLAAHCWVEIGTFRDGEVPLCDCYETPLQGDSAEALLRRLPDGVVLIMSGSSTRCASQLHSRRRPDRQQKAIRHRSCTLTKYPEVTGARLTTRWESDPRLWDDADRQDVLFRAQATGTRSRLVFWSLRRAREMCCEPRAALGRRRV
ncbi:hypothetical protein BD414DRAFT_59414 [Trametes punicea]|nr:hypothetical protein BD414DRAFT_59414 [Trametes punicea]